MFEPNCVLIKNAPEIHLKTSFVEDFFLKKLREHIRHSLKKNNIEIHDISSERGRIVLKSGDLGKSLVLLKKVFGIHAISIAQSFEEKDFEKIIEKTLSCCGNFFEKEDTFAVRASVVNSKPFHSREIEMALGEKILRKFPFLKVSLKFPKKEVFVEVKKDSFYVFFENFKGLGGIPVGCEGNVGVFFSEKKECLAASYLMLKRGCNVFPIIKEKTPEIEKNISLLLPFNSFQDFFLTEEKDLQTLIEKKQIIALIDCSKTLDKSVLEKISENRKKFQLPFFYPLLCFPKEELERILKLVENEK